MDLESCRVVYFMVLLVRYPCVISNNSHYSLFALYCCFSRDMCSIL
jgi:hypothetical protein